MMLHSFSVRERTYVSRHPESAFPFISRAAYTLRLINNNNNMFDAKQQDGAERESREKDKEDYALKHICGAALTV